MNNSDSELEFKGQFAKFAALLLAIIGIVILPMSFKALFSFGPLHFGESRILYFVSSFFFLISIIVYFRYRNIKLWISSLILTFFVLFAFEILFRIVVLVLGSEKAKNDLAFQSNITYQESIAYTGHPFLNFTGKSKTTLVGNKALRGDSPFNNYGFVGSDFYKYKSPNTIRIACLGESTTADGFPLEIERYLNTYKGDIPYKFEVLNFGHAYWTTAHSLTNFVLNVMDFNFDFLVIHHGWNEEKIRNVSDEVFKNDYSHSFKSFEEPSVYDRYIIRISGIYRFLKFKFDRSPAWATLSGSTQNKMSLLNYEFSDLHHLKPFKRNIESIITLSRNKGKNVFLVTLPRSMDSLKAMYYAFPNIDQCNQITRSLANSYSSGVQLVDLDSILTGNQEDIFVDLAHVNDEGRLLKSKHTGDAMLKYIRALDPPFRPNYEKDDILEPGIVFYSNMIKADSVWFLDVKNKAKQNKISLDEMIRNDAIHMVKIDMKSFEKDQ